MSKNSHKIWTRARIEPALRKAHGVGAIAARLLSDTYGRPCSPGTICDAIKADEYLQEVRRQARENVKDLCEYRVFQRADFENDFRAQTYLLNNLAKDRGYGNQVTKVEFESKPISVQVLKLSDRDQAAA
jgi:hypothetical protein